MNAEMRDVCYAIPHGWKFRAALLEPAEEDDERHAFRFLFTDFCRCQRLNTLKQMVSCPNVQHSDRYFIETTPQNALTVLKEDYVRLRADGSKKVTDARVCHEFDCISQVSRMMIKLK